MQKYQGAKTIENKIWDTLSNAVEEMCNSKNSCKTIENKSLISFNSKSTYKSKFSAKSILS